MRAAAALLALAAAAFLAIATAAGPAVRAHHGWGSYETTLTRFTGPIKTVKFENPHVEIELDAEGKTWTITLAPPFRMNNRGLPKEQLTAGKIVTVAGYKSRAQGAELRAENILIDGKTVELR
jgi:hypothetical protein